MSAARSAFTAGDVDASKAAHDAKATSIAAAVEDHGGAGAEYVKSIVFGAIDGVITEFALLASVSGSGLPIEVALITGVAKLLGDALSMAIGDTMSEHAEHLYIRGERKREEWEYDNYPEGEKEEMIQIYQEKGFSREEATKVITIMSKPQYKSYFIDHMMAQEVGEQMPDEDASPIKNGLVTLGAFMVAALIPFIAYIIFYGANYKDGKGQIGICSAVTLLTLYGLGMVQAAIIKQNMWVQGFYMMINGGLAAAAAYLIGWGLHIALNVNC